MILVHEDEQIQIWHYPSTIRTGKTNELKKYRYFDPISGLDRGYLSKQAIKLRPTLRVKKYYNCSLCNSGYLSFSKKESACSLKCQRLLREGVKSCNVCSTRISFKSKGDKCHACLLKKQSEHRRYKKSPLNTKIKRNITSLISQSLKLKGYKKSSKTAKLLTCTIEQFHSHIESLFDSGMTWSNWGQGVNSWQIDHICPCNQAQNEQELIKLQHYSNLQPLWTIDNIKKSDKSTLEAQKVCLEILGRQWVYNIL